MIKQLLNDRIYPWTLAGLDDEMRELTRMHCRRAPHNLPSVRGPQARGNPALAMTRNPVRAYCRGPDAADRDAVWLFSILVLFSRTSNGFSLGRDLSDRVVERPRRLAEPRRPAVRHVKAVLDADAKFAGDVDARFVRSEEHTSELQSLMRISYAVFCLKKKNKSQKHIQ